MRRLGIVAFADVTAKTQGDPHRVEESRRHETEAGRGPRVLVCRRALGHDGPDAAAHGHRQETDVRGLTDARQLAHLTKHPAVERGTPRCLLVAGERERGAERLDVFDAEARDRCSARATRP